MCTLGWDALWVIWFFFGGGLSCSEKGACEAGVWEGLASVCKWGGARGFRDASRKRGFKERLREACV